MPIDGANALGSKLFCPSTPTFLFRLSVILNSPRKPSDSESPLDCFEVGLNPESSFPDYLYRLIVDLDA